jgi:hypothetical protein
MNTISPNGCNDIYELGGFLEIWNDLIGAKIVLTIAVE